MGVQEMIDSAQIDSNKTSYDPTTKIVQTF